MRFPKPWYRPNRGVWYVTIEGAQHNLGPDRDEAMRQYRRMMATPPAKKVRSDSVAAVIDAFLDWCEKHRAPDTYEWYRCRLQRFISFASADLRTSQLRPLHVQKWIDGYEHLSNGSKRNYCRAIQRAMRWAEQQGYIDRRPIAHMEKPPAGKREVGVSQAEFDRILEVTRDRAFRDLLITTWETGCRPQESLRVKARPRSPKPTNTSRRTRITCEMRSLVPSLD